MMKAIFQKALTQIGDHTKIIDWHPVRGGDINEAYYLCTNENEYFIKIHNQAPKHFFQQEAEGLEEIKKAEAIHVPIVYGYQDSADVSYLIMEWINGKTTEKTGELLGQGVARLHQYRNTRFGFSGATYIGEILQKQDWYDSWIDYYREIRLLSQIQLAEENHRLPISLRKKLDTLLEQIDRWLPEQCTPSLLHGDLWGGNWLAGPEGVPYLIDPSVFYGHNEFEIAFTQLFGGFPDNFYRAYEEICPLSPEYEERKPLYQLYYLLVHLNLFGEVYLGSVERIVHYYVGK